MPTITKFPLFNLPFVAIDEVLKTMPIIEQIQLSAVSKKTQNIVKSFSKRRRPYQLYIFVGVDMRMYFTGKTCGIHCVQIEKSEESDSSKSRMIFDNVTVEFSLSGNDSLTTTYWKNKSEGMKCLLSYFMNVFNLKFAIKFFGSRNLKNCPLEAERLFTEILDMIEQQKSTIEDISFMPHEPSNEVCQKVFEVSCRSLDIFSCSKKDFQYNNSEKPINIEYLQIRGPHSVNLEDLLYCKQVTMKETNIDVQDFNQFLKKWLASDSPLKFLNCEQMDYSNFSSIVKGIPAMVLNKARVLKIRFEDFKDGRCFQIQRSNGEKAIVCQYGSSVIFKTSTYRYNRTYF